MGMTVLPNGQWICTDDTTSVESFAKSYIDRYAPLAKSAETSLFRRFEDKYILPKTLKDSLDKVLAKHMIPDYPDKKTKFNVMKSVYFDSSNLDMVKHHLSKSAVRFKIRTREYAPNGKLFKSDFTYLEVKAKQDGVCDKFRIKVPRESMESFKKGLPIVPGVELIKANPHIGVVDLVKRVQDINSALTTFSLRPSCEVSYTRHAFSDGQKDNGLRVTYDQGVNNKLLDVFSTDTSNSLAKGDDTASLTDMVAGYNPDEHIILEVKHHGIVPDWLSQFLVGNSIPQASFSKYCYSMAKSVLAKK